MPDLDATALVGLLADAHRRRVVAAIELGARHVDGIVTATGLTSTQVAKALGKLVEAGLVVSGDDGLGSTAIRFNERLVRRTLVRRRPSSPMCPTRSARSSRVRRDGRLQSMPVAAGKRLVILDWLAQDFEPGTTYSEKMVNLILGKRHADTAMLRRYLVDRRLPRSGRGSVLAKRRYGRSVTHYEVLGVSRDASTSQIRAAFRRLARAHHPDTSASGSAESLAPINEAWRVLGDPCCASLRPLARGRRAAATSPSDWAPSPTFVPPPESTFPWRFLTDGRRRNRDRAVRCVHLHAVQARASRQRAASRARVW